MAGGRGKEWWEQEKKKEVKRFYCGRLSLHNILFIRNIANITSALTTNQGRYLLQCYINTQLTDQKKKDNKHAYSTINPSKMNYNNFNLLDWQKLKAKEYFKEHDAMSTGWMLLESTLFKPLSLAIWQAFTFLNISD